MELALDSVVEEAASPADVVEDETLAFPQAAAPAPGEELRNQDGVPLSFRVRFSQSTSFKIFFENIANVLQDGFFEVVKTTDFQGLAVEAVDASHVCMVLGRLGGSVEIDASLQHDQAPASFSFCLRLAVMLSCIKSMHPQHFVELSMEKNSDKLVLRIYEPDVASFAPTFRLSTLAKECEGISLEGLSFAYYVEIDLLAFRGAIRTANEQKADSVTIFVLEPRRPPTAPAARRKTTFFVVRSCADEIESTFPFQSTTEEDVAAPQPRTIRVTEAEALPHDYVQLPPLETLDVRYRASFSTSYLLKFTKAMERSVLTLRLGPDKAMLLEFPCDASSYLRFVLAPKAEDC